jgi:hypothetical protein
MTPIIVLECIEALPAHAAHKAYFFRPSFLFVAPQLFNYPSCSPTSSLWPFWLAVLLLTVTMKVKCQLLGPIKLYGTIHSPVTAELRYANGVRNPRNLGTVLTMTGRFRLLWYLDLRASAILSMSGFRRCEV